MLTKSPRKRVGLKSMRMCGYRSLGLENAIRTYALETQSFYELLL